MKRNISVLVVMVLISLLLVGCSKKNKIEPNYNPEEIIEVVNIDDKELHLVLQEGEYIFYDKETNDPVEMTDDLERIIDKYKETADTGDSNPDDVDMEPEGPSTNVEKPEEPATPSDATNEDKPTEPDKPGEPNKPKEPVKPTDKVTYGSVEYIDTAIQYKRLDDKADPNKDEGTSGWISKGVNGVSRKEVRKVFVNGKYSHTEVVKNTYTFKNPVNEQGWYGTKKVENPEDTGRYRDDYAKEVIRLVNEEREKQKLPKRTIGNSVMKKDADKRALDIVDDYSHNGSITAEALYKNIGMTPKQAVDGWLKSSGHRDILLSPHTGYISVGVYEINGWVHYALLISQSETYK